MPVRVCDALHRGLRQEFSEVFPHLVTAAADVPTLAKIGDVDWGGIDAAFCCLPHATTQEILKSLPRHIKIVDLSADFRLKDTAVYAEWCAAATLPGSQAQQASARVVHARGRTCPSSEGAASAGLGRPELFKPDNPFDKVESCP